MRGFPGTLIAAAMMLLTAPAPAQAEDPASFVKFGEDFGATCVSRNSVTVTVKSTHPTRTVRVWLERYLRDVNTGDRSKSDLRPNGEPEDLGCSRSLDGAKQEWRVLKAIFVEG